MSELKIKDYTEYASTSLESANGLLGTINNFSGMTDDDTIFDPDAYSESEILALIQKLPPELFKSGVAQQVIQTARSGQRIIIDGKNNRIEFYGDDGAAGLKFYEVTDEAQAASIEVYYSAGAGSPVSGMNVNSGGGSYIDMNGKSNTGFINIGFDDTVDVGGIDIDWSGGDMPGTVATTINSRLNYAKTELTDIGAGFTLTASTLKTPFITLSASAARTSDTSTAIADGTNTGQCIVLLGTSDSNTITIKDNANTALAGDCILGLNDTLTLIFNGSVWCEISRSNN